MMLREYILFVGMFFMLFYATLLCGLGLIGTLINIHVAHIGKTRKKLIDTFIHD